jgi:hypothetical protein
MKDTLFGYLFLLLFNIRYCRFDMLAMVTLFGTACYPSVLLSSLLLVLRVGLQLVVVVRNRVSLDDCVSTRCCRCTVMYMLLSCFLRKIDVIDSLFYFKIKFAIQLFYIILLLIFFGSTLFIAFFRLVRHFFFHFG